MPIATPPTAQIATPPFTLQEHATASYGPRTYANASADATFAYAADFLSAGERLTKKAAGARLLQVPVGTPSPECARLLIAHLDRLGAHTLNVAGNGLHTLARHFPGHTPAALQTLLNAYLLRVLRVVHAGHPLTLVRSGGQTGVDEAGLVAALALGIPALGLLPHGYRIRTAAGIDRTMSRTEAWQRFLPGNTPSE